MIKNKNILITGTAGFIGSHLFEGLIPERIAIAVRCISACWGALAHSAIYANMRRQFDKEILLFQGVGFTLADLWAKTAAITHGVLKFAETYDEKFKKYGGNLPDPVAQSMVSSASQYKYICAKIAKEVCFETASLMGRAGVCDNTLMQDYIGVSRILEVVGGTKEVQKLIMSRGLRRLFKNL